MSSPCGHDKDWLTQEEIDSLPTLDFRPWYKRAWDYMKRDPEMILTLVVLACFVAGIVGTLLNSKTLGK